MIRLGFIALLGILPLNAAIQIASDTTLTNVQAAVDAAAAGDIVVVPAGSSTWTDELNIAKSITLLGAGIDQTTITINRNTGTGANIDTTIHATVQATGVLKIAGFTFDDQNNAGQGIYVDGAQWGQCIISDCKFTNLDDRAIYCDALVQGVVYRCEFDDVGKVSSIMATDHVEESWDTALTLGTISSFVFEDCTIVYNASSWQTTDTSTWAHDRGGRSIIRYNTWTNSETDINYYPVLDVHGNQGVVTNSTPTAEPPDGDSANRGTRQVEFYNNTITDTASRAVRETDLRGGTVLLWNNTWTDTDTDWQAREEDAPYDDNLLSVYPGYDQHRLWIWGNTPTVSLDYVNAQDQTFIVEDTNLYYREPGAGDLAVTDYKPLSYPHPWRTDSIPVETFVNYEDSTAGTTMTTTILDNGTVEESAGTWTITATDAASNIKVGSESRAMNGDVSVSGTDYDGAGSRSLEILYDNDGHYTKYDFPNTEAFSLGFWFKFEDQDGDWSTSIDWIIVAAGADFAVFQTIGQAPSTFIGRAHTSLGTGGSISVSTDTWYWVTMYAVSAQSGGSLDGSCAVWIYDANLDFVGAGALAVDLDQDFTDVDIGRADAHGDFGGASDQSAWFDSFALDLGTDFEFPLLPETRLAGYLPTLNATTITVGP